MIYKNEKVKEFIDYCSKNDIDIYLVGGSTRDYLKEKKESFDLDFSLVSDYDRAFEIIKKEYKCKSDDKYQSIKLTIDEYNIEISHARKERDYLDFRHPDTIEFTNSIELDSKRRDFTINAIYYKDDKYYDFHNGINDLKENKLRVIGDTLTRFKEDPLRILRMIRFSMLGYDISYEDERVIKDNTYLLKELSEASFNKEFDRILDSSNMYVFYEYKEVFESYYETKFKDISVLDRLGTVEEKKTYLGIKNKSNLYKYRDLVITGDKVELTKLIYKFSSEVIAELVRYHDKIDNTNIIKVYNEIIANDYYTMHSLAITSKEIIEIIGKEELTSYFIDKVSYAIIEGKLRNDKNEIIKYLKEQK